jgi:uncharacterized protein YbaR (Trm112 family)/SAM-dependent methyltransferase
MSIYDILACPICKVQVIRQGEALICSSCQRTYPIVNNVPVLLPDQSIPTSQHHQDLDIRPSYDPWIHRVIIQSLPGNAIILDLGAGNLTLNLPNVIRMDVTLTPYVDVVGDAHALPFLPGVLDFVFSLAVIEHLRQPFLAAQEMYRVLKPGGYIYGECNFVFAYHGFPHHYFNASQQGIEQVFQSFDKIRSGVAPYQMPSFAIRMLLLSYLRDMKDHKDLEIKAFRLLLQNVLDQPLGTYDLLFTEEAALNTAAGVFFFGRKVNQETSNVIPEIIQNLWNKDIDLKKRFPSLFDLGSSNNIMIWSKKDGYKTNNEVKTYFDNIIPFHKNEALKNNQQIFNELPVIEPKFGHIVDVQRDEPLSQKNIMLQKQIKELETTISNKDKHILYLENLIKQIESGRVMRLLRFFRR